MAPIVVTPNNVNFSINDYIEALDGKDNGDAILLEKLFADKVLFDYKNKTWFFWARHYWVEDQTNYIIPLLTETLRIQYERALTLGMNTPSTNTVPIIKRLEQIGTYTKITNVQKLFSSRPKIAFDGNNWDLDPWLLAVENGVIDLKTGILYDGKPDQYIRAYAPVKWKGINEKCPKWDKFQKEITGGNEEIIDFKRRLFGYSLVGASVEHILPILYDSEGRNGKSTETETIMAILGDKLAGANSADMLMCMRKSSEGAKPFTVELKGIRFFVARESSQGDRIDAGYVKEITGGDTIKARPLNGAPISFKPSHTPFLVTNSKPHISSDDSAMWERIILINYGQRFVENPDPNKDNEHQRNLNMKEDLKAEYSGILAWLVSGCLEWQHRGLDIPDEIKRENKNYRIEEDDIQRFIDDICDLDPIYSENSMTLYHAYKDWAFANGEKNPMTNNAFGRKLSKRFEKKRMTRGFVYIGICIDRLSAASP